MAGIEEAFEKFVTRVSSRERSPAEQPLSKYKSYSEQELLENIEAKYPNQLQSFSQEDYQLNTMPMFEPRDVAPPKSYSPMPVEKYLRGREYMDLANGGVAGMFRERPGYAEGGNIVYKGDDDFFLNFQKGVGFVRGPNGWEFNGYIAPESNLPEGYSIKDAGRDEDGNIIKEIFKDPNSTGTSIPTTTEIPTIDPFSGQQVSAQDLIDINKEMSAKAPPGGFSEEGLRKNADDDAGRLQSMMEAFNSGFYNNTPTVDPFSGQQVSAQEQAAFTQPQPEIFPTSNNIANTLNVGSSDPLTNILGSQVGNLSYSEMNALRNRSPNVLSSNVGANLLQALGTGLKDFAYVGDKLGPDYYKNLSGNFFENIKNLDKGFSYDPTYMGADKTGRLDYYKQGIKSLLGMNTPGSNVGGGTPGMRYAIEQISPYLSKTVGPALNILGSAPVTAFGILDVLTGPANAPEVGRGPEYFRQQLQLPENSPVSRFNQVQDPRSMMAYGGRVSMSNGGLTKTVPPVRGPSPQGVESLFRRRYN
jgi:hypothetical protein